MEKTNPNLAFPIGTKIVYDAASSRPLIYRGRVGVVGPHLVDVCEETEQIPGFFYQIGSDQIEHYIEYVELPVKGEVWVRDFDEGVAHTNRYKIETVSDDFVVTTLLACDSGVNPYYARVNPYYAHRLAYFTTAFKRWTK